MRQKRTRAGRVPEAKRARPPAGRKKGPKKGAFFFTFPRLPNRKSDMLLFKEEVKMGVLMKKKDLESALRRLEADLEDLEETMSFNLSYTSAHIGGAQVRKDEEALGELRQEIARIRTLLKAYE